MPEESEEGGSSFIWPAGELIFRILEIKIPKQAAQVRVAYGLCHRTSTLIGVYSHTLALLTSTEALRRRQLFS